MSSEATSLYFSCNSKCVFQHLYNKWVLHSPNGCVITHTTYSLLLLQSGSSAEATRHVDTEVAQTVLTLRGDTPPTYTKSTSWRFIMCSNICLLGSARTAGLEEEESTEISLNQKSDAEVITIVGESNNSVQNLCDGGTTQWGFNNSTVSDRSQAFDGALCHGSSLISLKEEKICRAQLMQRLKPEHQRRKSTELWNKCVLHW